eukprot:TRINITY_DN36750_c0_g1_i1.p3 TRINITY_DN36750_c0_g1~~TRINITY_DN36750_c0_g1_i1.p3  ORF type:complete len:147 (+),score=40.27 TRINITY_DN36750_c0_g1_i1:442-882(+)
MSAAPGKHEVYWGSRKGFVRLAVEYGIPLIPAYTFGETDLYDPIPLFCDFRAWLCRRFHIATPLAAGRWWCPVLPKKVPLATVIGTPMPVKKVAKDDPSFDSVVDAAHEEFCGRLVALFDKHKAEYASESAKLQITGKKEPNKKKD